MADPSWVINVKPLFAGVRVLCLDSGGVNGIIELKVLQAIEKVLGPKLPVQLFFDLIAGTRILPYEFVRPGESSKETKIWEAWISARATTAATPYFKIFQKEETGDQYVESVSQKACPVEVAHQETKLIWSDIANLPPDIMLSVGTGYNVKDGYTSQSGKSTNLDTDSSSSMSIFPLGNPFSKSAREVDKTDDQACNRMWNKFVSGKFTSTPSNMTEERRRYVRISPELNIPAVKFDDIQRIDEIEREAEEVLQQNMLVIKEVAHRLIASTFFFEKGVGSVKQTTSGYTCKGSICCRFRSWSDEMKSLGAFFISGLKGNFEPYFLIEDDIPGGEAQHIVLTEAAIRNMQRQGYFDIEPIQINALKEYAAIKISLCLQSASYVSGEITLPISGFPRQLMSEDANYAGALPRSHDPSYELDTSSANC
ncbi:hypothetical protein ABKA04_005976 [Annulohypoxylon sp. FPYF3050]